MWARGARPSTAPPPWRPASPPWPPAGRRTCPTPRWSGRLRDWRNRRQHNKTGLIPRLEGELAEIDDALARQAKAFRLSQEAKREMDKLQAEHKLLQAERDAHLARAMAARRERWEAAQAALAEAQGQVDSLEAERTRYGTPPDRDTLQKAQEELNQLNALHTSRKQAESQLEEARPAEAEAEAAAEDPLFPEPDPRPGLAAGQRRRRDGGADAPHRRPVRRGRHRCPGAGRRGPGAGLCRGAARPVDGAAPPAACWRRREWPCWLAAVAAKSGGRRPPAELLERYEAESPQDILTRASAYREPWVVAEQAAKQPGGGGAGPDGAGPAGRADPRQLLELVHPFAPSVTDSFGVSAAISRALNLEQKLSTARVRLEGAKKLADSLPRPEDGLEDNGVEPRFDPAETAARLEAAEGELSRLRGGLAMAQGELNTLGDREELTARREASLEELDRRKREHAALTAALEALEKAHAGLQARFSPALNRRAGELLAKLTGGKYDKVSLTREFEALAEEHDGLLPRRALALSRGTADQLYLAVRLAVCQLVLPGEEPCPLVLDDALANFDDARMALALETLEELGQERQILLFTCHGREAAWQTGKQAK